MFNHTSLALGLFRRSNKDVRYLLESHFWGLTRYRIGPRFLGLDYAGNIIFYPSYRKQTLGGWTAVTLGPGDAAAGNSSFLTSDMSSVNVLEDGYPMHYKASKKLQQFVSEERARWQKKVDSDRAAAAAQKKSQEAKAAAAGGTDAAASAGVPQSQEYYDSDLQFRDLLAIKFAHPRFSGRHLRLSPLSTFLYKCFYFYLWAVLVSLIVQGYLWFRNWVNPPARQGLRHIEEEVLHIPRLLFAGVVYGVARLVQMAQPIIDPIVAELTKLFPQMNFDKYTSENLADRAKHLADDTHPSAEKWKEEKLQTQQKHEADRKTWWTRALIALLAIFSVLCIL